MCVFVYNGIVHIIQLMNTTMKSVPSEPNVVFVCDLLLNVSFEYILAYSCLVPELTFLMNLGWTHTWFMATQVVNKSMAR